MTHVVSPKQKSSPRPMCYLDAGLALVICTALSYAACCPSSRAEPSLCDAQSEPSLQAQFQIELSTDKRVYKLGEPIVVTVTLTNVSKEPLFASVSPSLAKTQAGGVLEIEVFDRKGMPMRGTPAIAEFWGLQNEPLYDWIRKTRRLYLPGDFVGVTRTLGELGFVLRQPGLYCVSASYWESDFKDWASEKELDAIKKKLTFPLWAGRVRSNAILVQVRR